MLVNGSRLIDLPLMSLQTGGEIGRTRRAIIDPAQLEIVAYQIESPLLGKGQHYVLIQDVRELSDMGFIVDSIDECVSLGDVIHLDDVASYHFDIKGRAVTNQHRRRIGKIVDYTIDVDSFYIQQLITKRPLYKSLNDTELIIHRSQITEINDKSVVINEEADVPEHTRVSTPRSYVNPFRSSEPATDAAEITRRSLV